MKRELCPRCAKPLATLRDLEQWVSTSPQSEEPWMRALCWFETPGTCGSAVATPGVELGAEA